MSTLMHRQAPADLWAEAVSVGMDHIQVESTPAVSLNGPTELQNLAAKWGLVPQQRNIHNEKRCNK